MPSAPAGRPPSRQAPVTPTARLLSRPPAAGRRSAGWVPEVTSQSTATDRLERPGHRRPQRGVGAELAARCADRLPPSVRAARWGLPASAAAVALLLAAVVAGVLVAGATASAPARPVPARAQQPVTTATNPEVTAAAPPAAVTAQPAAEVVVHVVGQVVSPGLVRLPAGARVADAVEAAGGLTAEADSGRVNLARALVDGEQVHVPRPGEPLAVPAPVAAGGEAASGGAPPAAAPVDLNAATLDQLDALPGIGPVLAQRILDWREQNGRFSSVDELGEVSGIGDKLLEQLRPLVRV